jgi:hypothetical protein
MTHKLTTSYLEDSLALFRFYKKMGEGAMEQVSDEQLFAALDGEMNSIAIMVKHMAGNMRSRWTDFLTSDGEKPDRDRDSEFLAPLSEADMQRTVTIRGEAHSVMQAVNRQIAHYSYHVGQIVFLAKHFRASEWKSLSVPRNKSAEFNRKVVAGEVSQR